MKLLNAMTLAAAIGVTGSSVSACSSHEDCTIEPSSNGILVTDTLLDDCSGSITRACRDTNDKAACAISYDDPSSEVQKIVMDCADPEGIASTCDSGDVLMCEITKHPEETTVICDGEVR